MKTELKITVADESGIIISYTEGGKDVDLDNSANRTSAYLILSIAKDILFKKGNEQSKTIGQNNESKSKEADRQRSAANKGAHNRRRV